MSEKNGYASREAFLAPTPRRYADVTLPAKGVKVRIRSMTELEKQKFDDSLMSKSGGQRRDKLIQGRCLLAQKCLCDGNGDLMLSEADIDQLKSLDAADLTHIYEKCMEHCGFRDGDMEGLVGNSESGQTES